MALDNKLNFAKLIYEGFSATEAFRRSFDHSKYTYETIRARASQIAKEKVVVEEIERLKNEDSKSIKKVENYEVSHAMEELEKAYRIAERTGNASSMIKTTELKARLHGLLKNEKPEIKISTVSTLDIKDLITLKDFLKDKVEVIEPVEEVKLIEDAEIINSTDGEDNV